MALTTRDDWAHRLAKKSGFTVADCQYIFHKVFEVVMDALCDGETVRVSEFGTFEPQLRKGGRQVKTFSGEVVYTKDKVLPKFTPAKLFKDRINGVTDEETPEE